MKEPKLLIVCGPYWTAGAQSNQNRRLARSVAQVGATARVLSVLPNPTHVRNADDATIRVEERAVGLGLASQIERLGSRALWRATEQFEANFLFPHDRSLRKKLELAIQDFDPDVCVFIAQPSFIPLVGLHVASSRPKVAFFSDPWPYDRLPPPYNRLAIPLTSMINERLFTKILSTYARIVYTNQQAVDFMLRNYPATRKHLGKVSVIPHFTGLDMEPPKDAALCQKARRSVVHIGELGRWRMSTAFVSALCSLVSEHGVEFLFVGVVAAELKRLAQSEQFASCITVAGVLPDTECKYLYSIARLNLVVEAEIDPNPFLPSKIADIVCSSERSVIVTGLSSPARRLQAGTRNNSALAFARHDAAEIVKVTLAQLEASAEKPELPADVVRRQSIEHNEKLAHKFLDAVLDKRIV